LVPVERLSEIPFFQGLPAWALRRVAAAASERALEATAVILRQHDEVRDVFFLRSGSVQFLLRFEGIDDLVVGMTSEAGALLGWSRFRAPFRSTSTLRCETACHLLSVPGATLEEVMREDPRLGYRLLKRVAMVLANRLEQARDRLVGG
jgi:CRP-like cAMP-binding protein